jgi:hypothetical protein
VLPLAAMDVGLLIVEQAGDLVRWPFREASLFASRHLHYQERFRLTIFLLGNGVDPEHILQYYSVMGSLRDASAVRHVQSLDLSFRTDAAFRGHARFALLSSAENRGLPRTPGGTKLPPAQGGSQG